MKLFTYLNTPRQQHLGVILTNGFALDITRLLTLGKIRTVPKKIPFNVLDLIELGEEGVSILTEISEAAELDKLNCLVALKEIVWCAPIPRPNRNIFCVGRNYKAHIIEGNLARNRSSDDFPKAVEFFTKPPSAVTGHRSTVSSHSRSTQMLDYEVELAIVIGTKGIDISESDALAHIFGYTIINDITARDLQVRHGQWFKGKALDGTCPMGPFIVPRKYISHPEKLEISLSVNEEMRQLSNTSDLLFGISQIIHQLSDGMMLEPGDVIATGTPSGVGLGLKPQKFLKPGDVVTARVESIGELVNTIN